MGGTSSARELQGFTVTRTAYDGTTKSRLTLLSFMFCWARAKKLKLAEFGRRNGAGPRVRGATPFAAACCIPCNAVSPQRHQPTLTASAREVTRCFRPGITRAVVHLHLGVRASGEIEQRANDGPAHVVEVVA